MTAYNIRTSSAKDAGAEVEDITGKSGLLPLIKK
jgi:hypothetical protein